MNIAVPGCNMDSTVYEHPNNSVHEDHSRNHHCAKILRLGDPFVVPSHCLKVENVTSNFFQNGVQLNLK